MNELEKRAKQHRKKQKGLSPFCSLKRDAGNVEHNVAMFNHMNSPTEIQSNNPVSGPFGGSAGSGEGMGESFTDNHAKMESLDLLTELNSLEACKGVSKVPYELAVQYKSVLNEFPVGTVLKLKIDAGEETYTKKDSEFWKHYRAPWGDTKVIHVFDLARWFAGRENISRSSIEYGQKELNETYSNHDLVQFDYENLPVTYQCNYTNSWEDGPQWDECDTRINYTYSVDRSIVEENLCQLIVDNMTDEEYESAGGDDGIDSYLDKLMTEKFDDLVDKYMNQLKEIFKDDAIEDAEENYDFESALEPDWDTMPGGYDDLMENKVFREDIDSTYVDYGNKDSEWIEMNSKQVMDSDGFLTDYTWYSNADQTKHVFVFGDKDIYGPEDGYFDWECDTAQEAYNWFKNYNGFEDDLDESTSWSRYHIVTSDGETIDSYTDYKDAEDWVKQLYKDGDFKRGELTIVDSYEKKQTLTESNETYETINVKECSKEDLVSKLVSSLDSCESVTLNYIDEDNENKVLEFKKTENGFNQMNSEDESVVRSCIYILKELLHLLDCKECTTLSICCGNKETLEESVTDKTLKRVSSYGEFDNGYVFHDWKKMTFAEAEEEARKASIKDPNDVYYVAYDNVMDSSSDYVWVDGKKYENSEVTLRGGKPYIKNDDINESTKNNLADDLYGSHYEGSPYGVDGYNLYRYIEKDDTGKPVKGYWAAEDKDGNRFRITYAQARGEEPISNSGIKKLSKELGKKLLPDRMNEASYGGAYDIADDQYFTREDADYLAETIEDVLVDSYEMPVKDVFVEIDKQVAEVTVILDDEAEYTASTKIDMRKIKLPRDIDKYTEVLASMIYRQVREDYSL